MISSLAHIDSAANIGKNVTIAPFAVIEAGVTIGDDTNIMSHVTILKGTTIGRSVNIFPNTVIGAIPQDLKFVGEETFVEIGNNTTIRESVTINRGTKDKWKTVIGNNCLLMAYVHVAHDCMLGNSVILANGVQLAGHVEIGDYAILGGLVGAPQFTKVGAHTYIAGHIVIQKDVPPFIKAGRDPLTYVGINSVGLQRRGYSSEKINEILEIYRYIYSRGMNISQAKECIKNELPQSTEKTKIINFIESSKRGIIKSSAKGGNIDVED